MATNETPSGITSLINDMWQLIKELDDHVQYFVPGLGERIGEIHDRVNGAKTVWIVEGDCGDYYCDGMHNLGVYGTDMVAYDRAAAMKQTLVHHVEAKAYELNKDIDWNGN
jgi:hypothetical protein